MPPKAECTAQKPDKTADAGHVFAAFQPGVRGSPGMLASNACVQCGLESPVQPPRYYPEPRMR